MEAAERAPPPTIPAGTSPATDASIGLATRAELDVVHGWACAEGWNLGRDDAEVWHRVLTGERDGSSNNPNRASAAAAAVQTGVLVRRVAGRPVAAVAVVPQGPDYAFVGLYLCEPTMRGRGHGLAVWRAGMQRIGAPAAVPSAAAGAAMAITSEPSAAASPASPASPPWSGPTLGLDAVAAQQHNYMACGFLPCGGTNTRFSGRVAAARAPAAALVRCATEADLDRLLAADRKATGVARQSYLRAWLQPSPSRQTLLVASGSRASAAAPPDAPAFATWRHCQSGIKIGPLYATHAAEAEALVRACVAAAATELESRLAGSSPPPASSLASHSAPAHVDAPTISSAAAAATAELDLEVTLDIPASSPALANMAADVFGLAPVFSTTRMYAGPPPVGAPPRYHALASFEFG